MRKIRIGNDFAVKWNVFVNDGNIPLESLENITLKLVDAIGKVRNIDKYTITGNSILMRFFGYKMTGECSKWKLGNYRIVLIVNEGDVGQAVLDQCDAFCLVSKTCETGDDTQDLQISTEIDLASSDLTFPYIASPLAIDENGVILDRRNGKKYQLLPYVEDGAPTISEDITTLKDDTAKIKQIIPVHDEDGNGIPDGEDRLNRIEEELNDEMTQEDIASAWDSVFNK